MQAHEIDIALLERIANLACIELPSDSHALLEQFRRIVAHMNHEQPKTSFYKATQQILASKESNIFLSQIKPYSTKQDGPLAGKTIAVKDNFCTNFLPTTCGSQMLKDYTPPYSATVVTRLLEAGAQIVGKTNMDEFGMGSSGEYSAFGPTLNPWDHRRVPGGSSSGSAAAVASGLVPIAIGSDTGGSVRQPASLCGVLGLKPTYGVVSRFGLVAFASSLDTPGILARTTKDLTLTLEAIAAQDPNDSTSIKTQLSPANKDSIRVGVIQELMGNGIERQVQAKVQSTIQALKKLGMAVSEVSLPDAADALRAYEIISYAEASSNLSRFDGTRFSSSASLEDWKENCRTSRSRFFGEEVTRRILLGTFTLSAGYKDKYYARAQTVRAHLIQRFDELFASGIDLLVCPTSPSTAFKLGERASDPVAMYQSDLCTTPASLAGLPALSIPCGLDDNGLPVGIQFIGPKLSESVLLMVCSILEPELKWPQLIPPGCQAYE